MSIFGNDAAAEHVIASLEDEDVELAKYKSSSVRMVLRA